MAVTMNYTTFHITNEKMFKMAKGRIRQTEELTYFLTMAATQRCERRTSLSLRVFSASVVCAKHRASWPFCKQTMASCYGLRMGNDLVLSKYEELSDQSMIFVFAMT